MSIVAFDAYAGACRFLSTTPVDSPREGRSVMGELADLLDRMTITVRSPDQHLTAHLDGQGHLVELEVDERAFRRYAADSLTRQLNQLGRLAYVAYRQEHRRLTEGVFDRPSYDAMVDEVGPELREYRRQLAEVVSRGASGEVQVSARGLADWEVHLPPGVGQRMTAEQFRGQVLAALAEVLADHEAQAAEVRRWVYGPVETATPVPDGRADAPLDRLRQQVARAIRAGSGRRR
jgi:hypothetical protein